MSDVGNGTVTVTVEQNEIDSVVEKVLQRIKPRQVLLFDGPMGAGKTTLIHCLVKRFGLDQVQSPTFAIHNSYAGENVEIDHFDLFRVEADELESTGFYEVFEKEEGLICIEWACKLPPNAIPSFWNTMEISVRYGLADEERTYQIK